jgi:hypothetical protein
MPPARNKIQPAQAKPPPPKTKPKPAKAKPAKTKPAKTKLAKAKPATAKPAPRPAAPQPAAPAKKPRIYTMSFASVYPLYVDKAVKKGRTQAEVDAVIGWLTGYRGAALQRALTSRVDFETFFAEAPALNPKAPLIRGVVCGVRVEDVAEPLMQKIRWLDKLVDELARGKKLESVLRA